LIAVGNEGGYLYLISNHKVQLKIRPHARPIKDICFLAQNKLLTASDDGLIKLVDLEKGLEEHYFYGHKYGVNALDKHPID
jgi:WD40 repeat protein